MQASHYMFNATKNFVFYYNSCIKKYANRNMQFSLVLVRYSIYRSIAILVNVRYRYLVVSRYYDISSIVWIVDLPDDIWAIFQVSNQISSIVWYDSWSLTRDALLRTKTLTLGIVVYIETTNICWTIVPKRNICRPHLPSQSGHSCTCSCHCNR